MANEVSLLLTISGSYTDSSLAGETWQNGIRAFIGIGADTPPLIGPLSTDVNVVGNTVSRTETDWTIAGNWKLTGPASGSFNADDWLNDQVAPAVNDWMAINTIAGRCQVDSLSVIPVGTNGKAIPAAPFAVGTPMTLTWTSSNPVGTGSNLCSPSVAIVQSWGTPQIGAKGRGRIFRAGISNNSIGADGFVTAAVAAAQRDASIALLEAIALSGNGLSSQPYVRPAVIGPPWNVFGAITSVTVDNVADTQRRRTKSLVRTKYTDVVTY